METFSVLKRCVVYLNNVCCYLSSSWLDAFDYCAHLVFEYVTHRGQRVFTCIHTYLCSADAFGVCGSAD